ncbi:MAG TPA: hypothetical protein VK648_00985 [Gemmatimonadaceae bacterium]|nr:MAG: hypothetical protein DMF56_19265 [Acidobacteriota bacterium]HTD82344.1 hypothetical protein [Gemmatimonadaceae bacterium]
MSLNELEEATVIATLIDRVAATGRFCGETLIQKSVFFLKELFSVPVSDRFRLYYYGPFSFELSDRLRGMQADDFVKVKPHQYGATFVPSERYSLLQRQFSKTIENHEHALGFVVRELATRGVGQLEPLATALFLTRQHPSGSVGERAQELHAVKPHVDLPVAIQSVRQIDEWIARYSSTS